MRINPEDFFDQIGATTEHQLNLKKNMAGYIDWDFDPSNYPNEWPRVILDGQGLSARTYPCLSSYQPMPGDRVILEALGSGHVIIGAVQDIPDRKLLPGTLVFKAYYNGAGTITPATANGIHIPWDNIELDLLAGWVGPVPSVAGDESGPAVDYSSRYMPSVPGWYQLSGRVGYTGENIAINNTNYLSANWHVNGSVPYGGASRAAAIQNQNQIVPAMTISVYLNGSTDYVELHTFYGAAPNGVAPSTRTLATNTFAPSMEARYMGTGSLTEPLPTIE